MGAETRPTKNMEQPTILADNGERQRALSPATCSASAATGKWVPAESALQIIRDPRWLWARNPDCKYIKLWVDTRDGHCIISDRNGKEISLRELSRQGDEYLTPNDRLQTRP